MNREHTEVLMELNINGIMDTAYSYGDQRLTNERFTDWTGYYTYDPRGSVTGVTDEKGMIWQSYRYDTFGSMTFGQPQYNNVYSYNAESYNPNVDAQYLRARYYSPTTADFISEDSYLGKLIDPLSLNRYNYTKSSPLNYMDPSGFVYIVAWSYGKTDVEGFEEYANKNLELSYKLDGNNDTSDWKKEAYDEFDQRSAFARAAQTKYEELIDQGVPEQEIVFTRVDKADDFSKKWKEWSNYEEVDELHLFSHGYKSGPEVYKGYVEPPSGIIKSSDVPLSEKLNFAENAVSVFYGCNTGKGDFAQTYADYQNVTTYAQSDYSSFSHDKIWRTHFVDTISNYEKGDKVYQGVYKYGLYFDTINISTDFGEISSTYFAGYRKNIEGLGVKFEPQN